MVIDIPAWRQAVEANDSFPPYAMGWMLDEIARLEAERDALRTANQEGEDVFRCAGCGTWWDSGWPNNEGECPECGTPFPQDAQPTHRLVPIVA